jgi:hypothetical protein
MSRLWAVAWKELVQLRRDRLTFGMMVGIPVIQLLLFGFAINTDVRHMPTLVYDQDQSAESRDFVQRMLITGFYDVVGYVHNYDEISRALRRGSAHVAVVHRPRRSWWWMDPTRKPWPVRPIQRSDSQQRAPSNFQQRPWPDAASRCGRSRSRSSRRPGTTRS